MCTTDVVYIYMYVMIYVCISVSTDWWFETRENSKHNLKGSSIETGTEQKPKKHLIDTNQLDLQCPKRYPSKRESKQTVILYQPLNFWDTQTEPRAMLICNHVDTKPVFLFSLTIENLSRHFHL